jgi:hypothetical protein
MNGTGRVGSKWDKDKFGPPGQGYHDYELFSERFRRIYPGYMLDKNMRIRARKETKVVNLK